MERGRHQRHLSSSGGWVPIKGEPGSPRGWYRPNRLAPPPPQSPNSLDLSLLHPLLLEYSSDHQATDMAEIDARLKALQEYMNRLDTRS